MFKYHVIFVSAVLALSASAQDLSLDIGNVNGVGMPQVAVPVDIVGGATPPAALILDLTYEVLLFRPNGVTAGAAATAATKTVSSAIIAPGTLRIVVSGLNQNTMGVGEIATINFDVLPLIAKSSQPKAATNTFAIGAADVSAAGADASALSVAVIPGAIVVGGGIQLPAAALWTLVLLATALVGAFILRRNRRAAAVWMLVLTFAYAPVATAIIAGDLNDSATVDNIDLQLFVDAQLGTPVSANRDLDFSGVVDARDLQLLVLAALAIDADDDEDGVLNSVEEDFGTNPNVADTDGDGVDDGEELLNGTDPLMPPSNGMVIINEFVASNEFGLQDEDLDHPDWIELYNGGAAPVDLAGWALTDDPAEAQKWVLPSYILGPDQFLVVFATGKDRDVGEFHTNFGLEKDGEYLALRDPSLAIKSEFGPQFPKQVTDASYGRFGAGPDFRYFEVPTPWAHNTIEGGVYEGVVDGFTIFPPRGFYDNGFSVVMSSATPNTTIRYTLDGTEPTDVNGMTYAAPFAVGANAVVRAVATAPDHLPTSIVTNTYIIGAPAAQKSLPVFSIAADPAESLYEPNGIMSIVGGHYEVSTFGILAWVRDSPSDINNPIEHGIAFERPTSFELIFPADNSGFQVNCGIRISGSDFHRLRYRRDPGADWTDFGPFQNMASYNKFSFRMYFRNVYGPGKLNYPLFEGTEVESFDKVVIRGGHNDGYNPFMKDELSRRLMLDAGQVSPRGMLANLFINGEYKAYYNVTERIDEDFLRDWHNTGEGFDIMGQPDNALSSGWEVTEGDDILFTELVNFAETQDISIPANYQWMADRIDIANFIDYLMVQLYTGNDDWPNRNWIAARERSATGLWRYYIWDSEGTFGGSEFGIDKSGQTGLDDYPFWGGNMGHPGGGGLKGENTPLGKLYRGLVQNATFRAQFAARAHELLEVGGALHSTNVLARYNVLKNEMLGVKPDFITYIEDTWVPVRTGVLTAALSAEGLY